MISRPVSRIGGALLGASFAVALAAVPTAASAVPHVAQEAAAGCEVSGGTLSWGLKESFRSYISGTIANGSWETSSGAGYETPNFQWGDASGSIEPETGTGAVSFTGTVHFTGHDGVLDLTLANPTIEFEGDGKAALLLDAKSTDMEGEVAVDEEQEWVGDLTVQSQVVPSDDALELADMPAELTNSGAGAFVGFYEAGAELDPVSVSLEFSGCDAATVSAPTEPAAGQDDAGQDDTETQAVVAPAPAIPWLPIGIGGVALLVIGFTVGMLVGGRKPKPQPQSQPRQTPAPEGEER
ncbi:hypothetical protein K8P10_000431 [Leucobacter sp. Psy1]|uniref:HtaA domain-containing protein n=1 Tax=Leucobacter sp. Psy1 TaxID=2875729 RepID=UPI001CD3918A|nr:HtaA domain-containing protein [Leucobacter sp. Psy1]UBH04920.1 hypothetical protein K8P10_000431 [Leucobacter sp. Psy1]